MSFRKFRKIFFPTARNVLLKKTFKNRLFSESKEILIVGAGEDPYRRIFPNANRYVCMDIEKVGDHIDVIGDAHKLPFDNCEFDTVFASEVLEHLHSPHVFIQETLRVLRPGGKIILTVPFMFHEHADPYDFWRPTESGLKHLCKDFSVIKILKQGNRIHTISDLITTSFSPRAIFFPFRILNFLLFLAPNILDNKTTAPSGFFLIATK